MVLNPGCSLTDLTPTDAVRQCADRGFANTLPIHSGVVCYNRTTPGSEAVYICDEGFHQDGASMSVCQSDGVWNASIPQCLPEQGGQDGTETLASVCHYPVVGTNYRANVMYAFRAKGVIGLSYLEKNKVNKLDPSNYLLLITTGSRLFLNHF